MQLEGYEIEFSNGETVRFAPRDKDQPALMEYKNFLLKIEESQFRFESYPDGKHGLSQNDIISAKRKTFELGEFSSSASALAQTGIRKTCGGGCCVTNGCCDCGGGWICDAR